MCAWKEGGGNFFFGGGGMEGLVWEGQGGLNNVYNSHSHFE